jgi:Histone RNA hairpin-binding protein RNA-binding domain
MNSSDGDVTHHSSLGKRDAGCRAGPCEPQSKRRRCWADEAVRLALQNGIETDHHRIAQRQKQVDYGKNTLAYDAFVAAVPRSERLREHPATPPVTQLCSKRSYDGQIKKWRRMLHDYKAKLDMHSGKTTDSVPCDKDADGLAVVEHMVGTEALDIGHISHAVVLTPAPSSSDNSASNPGTSSGSCAAISSSLVCTSFSDLEEDDLDDISLDDFGNVIPKSSTCSSPTNNSRGLKDNIRHLNTSPPPSKAQVAESSFHVASSIFGKF